MSEHHVPVKAQHFLSPQLTVIVTGAASGIGQAQAALFLSKGHRVMAVDYQMGMFEAWQAQYGEQFDYVIGDIAQNETATQVVEQTMQRFGQIDVLCNTAGILDAFHPLTTTTEAKWLQVMQTNVTSLFYMCQAALPYLLARPAARIINMASIAGLTAGGGGIAYTTSKHAVVGFTKQLAYDYAQTGLRVNAIAPGAIQTAMTAVDFEEDEAKMAQWVAEQVPVKRWAQPSEVAQLTLYLASDAADYMQGQVIPLDGGWLIR